VSAARESFFATCAPGLEPLLLAEARALKLPKLEQQTGGVYFEGTLAEAARANLWLRTAVRVLLRLSRFQAAAADELYRGAAALDWSRFLEPEGSLVVAAHSNESVLDHTLFVEQRVKDAICDQFRERTGKRPSVDKDAPDLGVHVHLFRDRCSLLVDTSGESLHKRGWRRYQGRAPLAETLAAAVVLDSGWDRRSPLVDPFCGSGTLLVEAAWLALGIAPGSLRERFAFERWKEWEPALSAKLRAQAQQGELRSKKLILRGCDGDAEALTGARTNLESAGVADRIELERGRAETYEYKRGWNAWIASNPPYGERIGDERELEGLFARFGARVRERCGGWHATLLSGNPRLTQVLGLKAQRVRAVQNGAIACELLHYEL
jgi:23S rRNA (guanine2445-N2)-methyltransferase / 23S rRNA (guanine2069-N7)-methyltransferase